MVIITITPLEFSVSIAILIKVKKVKNGHSVKEIKDVLYQLFQENNLGLG